MAGLELSAVEEIPSSSESTTGLRSLKNYTDKESYDYSVIQYSDHEDHRSGNCQQLSNFIDMVMEFAQKMFVKVSLL